MIVSNKYKFITIDIPKTGTRTIRQTLDNAKAADHIITGIDRHAGVSRAMNLVSDMKMNWDNYTKVCIVRNPWERYVSFLNYMKDCVKNYNKDKSNMLEGMIRQCKLFMQFTCLSDYEALKKIIQNQPTQSSYYENKDGKCLVDMFARTESLDSDIDTIFGKLGITVPLVKIKGNIGSYERNYFQYYNNNLMDLVHFKENKLINKFNFIAPSA